MRAQGSPRQEWYLVRGRMMPPMTQNHRQVRQIQQQSHAPNPSNDCALLLVQSALPARLIDVNDLWVVVRNSGSKPRRCHTNESGCAEGALLQHPRASETHQERERPNQPPRLWKSQHHATKPAPSSPANLSIACITASKLSNSSSKMSAAPETAKPLKLPSEEMFMVISAIFF